MKKGWQRFLTAATTATLILGLGACKPDTETPSHPTPSESETNTQTEIGDGASPVSWELSEDTMAYGWSRSLVEAAGATSITRDYFFLDFLQCTNGEFSGVPKTAIGSITPVDNSGYMSVVVTQPGTSAYQLKKYYQSLVDCGQAVQESPIEGVSHYHIVIDNTAVVALGDTLVTIIYGSAEELQSTLQEDVGHLAGSIGEAQCVNVEVRESDYIKNLNFVPASQYKSGKGSHTVSIDIDQSKVPQFIPGELDELDNPKMEEPEAPLPEGLQNTLEEPKFSATNMREVFPVSSFTTVVSYPEPDNVGPGCGWEWTGSEKFTVSAEEADKIKQEAISQAEQELGKKVQRYHERAASFALYNGYHSSFAGKWQAYAQEANALNAKWEKLEAEREAFKPTWDAFTQDYNEWATFDTRKKEAREKLSNERRACSDARRAHENWANQYSTKYSEGGDNTGIPPQPPDCDSSHIEEPAILSAEKPKEPIPPVHPDTITIPESWRAELVQVQKET